MGIVKSLFRSVPVVGQASGFYELAKNLTNATDVEGAVLGSLQIIKEEYVPPPFKLRS